MNTLPGLPSGIAGNSGYGFNLFDSSLPVADFSLKRSDLSFMAIGFIVQSYKANFNARNDALPSEKNRDNLLKLNITKAIQGNLFLKAGKFKGFSLARVELGVMAVLTYMQNYSEFRII